MSYKLVLKDAFWQIIGKVASALIGFFVVKLITPYLGPLRYGDYSTVLNYFVLWTAFADFGLYVISLKDLGHMRHDNASEKEISFRYSQYVWSRFFMIGVIYAIAMIIAYLLPSYTSNIYLLRGLPLGMVYSATALGGSMFRLPLQLNWNMKHVTIALILARVSQILVLLFVIYFFAPVGSFSLDNLPVAVFLAVVGSALASSLTEFFYVFFVGNKSFRLVKAPFLGFLRTFIADKWKYGLSQFFAGLHIPLMLIIVSVLYPTVDGFGYVGYWGLALSLIGMLLIVPSSLGNSMLHKVSSYDLPQQQKAFGSFFLLMLWLGLLLIVNFLVFSQPLIQFISGEKYLSGLSLSVYDLLGNVFAHFGSVDQTLLGTDFLLPLFAVVLMISFFKNVFTYSYVAAHRHNELFWLNLGAVLVGLFAGYFLVLHFQLLGAIVAQLVFGMSYLVLYYVQSLRFGIAPKTRLGEVLKVLAFFTLLGIAGYFAVFDAQDLVSFVLWAGLINLFIFALWYRWLKRVAKGLV